MTQDDATAYCRGMVQVTPWQLMCRYRMSVSQTMRLVAQLVKKGVLGPGSGLSGPRAVLAPEKKGEKKRGRRKVAADAVGPADPARGDRGRDAHAVREKGQRSSGEGPQDVPLSDLRGADGAGFCCGGFLHDGLI